MNEAPQRSSEIRLQQIKMRRAEIFALLAAMKHKYVTTGVGNSLAERTGLESEEADLALEALRIGADHVKAKAFRRMVTNADLLSSLLHLLDERGLWALAVEASERSCASLHEITQWRTTTTTTTEHA